MTSKRKNPCTNWFPGSVKPVRSGAYRRLYHWRGGKDFCWFDSNSQLFGNSAPRPDLAEESFNLYGASIFQNKAWCGLSRNPDEVAK